MKQFSVYRVLSVTIALSLLVLASATAQDGRRQDLFARFDRNNDGKISRDEFTGPQEFFSRFDTNGDGFITREEAAQLTGMGGEFRNRPPMGENLMIVLDADNDGKVTQEEFAGIVALFTQLDRDADNALNMEELGGLSRIQLIVGGVNIDELFRQHDADNNRKLSESELSASPQFSNPRFFKLLDRDKDGFVTKQEMKNFLRQTQSKQSQ